MKKYLLILFILLNTVVLFALDQAPIASLRWEWTPCKTIKGKLFYYVADSYLEQDGWAYIQGSGKIHYWLYDTYMYHDGYAEDLLDIYVPNWIESMGYVIDFDNIEYYSPNNNLASSVKALMAQRKCDVSVALIGADSPCPYVVINSYEASNDYYFTLVYRLIK